MLNCWLACDTTIPYEIDIFINIDDLDTHHYNPRLHTDYICACTAGLHVYIVTYMWGGCLFNSVTSHSN